MINHCVVMIILARTWKIAVIAYTKASKSAKLDINSHKNAQPHLEPTNIHTCIIANIIPLDSMQWLFTTTFLHMQYMSMAYYASFYYFTRRRMPLQPACIM